MVNTSESIFVLSDGTKLYEKTWHPESPTSPVAHMIALHGFSDHVNAYYNLFPTLASEPYNIVVHGIDQRGWGRSVTRKPDRGLSGDSRQVMKDIGEYVQHVSQQISKSSSSLPLFLFGHSMGGNEALYYTLTTDSSSSAAASTIAGLVLEAPFIGFPAGAAPNAVTLFAGKLAAKVLPSFQMVNKLDASAMSHDPAVNEAWVADELCHDTGTLAGVAGLLQRSDELSVLARTGKPLPGMRTSTSSSVRLPCPVFWTHGTGDLVCDADVSKALWERIGKDVVGSECRWYEGAYHKLHTEPDGVGEQFAKDVGSWIVNIVKNKKSNNSGKEGENAAAGSGSNNEDTFAGTVVDTTQGQSDVKSRL